MKKVLLLFTGVLLAVAILVARPMLTSKVIENKDNIKPMTSFYDFKMRSINGEEIDFIEFEGKKVLIVNVASKCGYTPQYSDLQKLHKEYGDKVVILGFPANNFGGQEPGSNEEIAEFCESNFGVSFRMFEKVSVKGVDKHPLYRWLSDKSQNGWNDQEPTWNFCKYLINENGELVKFYPSSVNPTDEKIIKDITS
jgi:glutathione peroxidase